jgi:hypothetical protein
MAERPLPAYDGDEAYVFVTYAHEDAELVYPHILWLQDQGFNVWWDEGISPGAAWRAELAQAIRGCSLLVYFVTPNSVLSEHCAREVNFALDEHHRPILAVHLSETSLPDTLALSLSDRQAIFQYALPPEDYDRKVVEALAMHLDRPAGEVSRPGPRSRLRRLAWLTGAAGVVAGAALAGLATWIAVIAQPDARPTDTTPAVRVPFPLEGWIGSMPLHTAEATMAIAPNGDLIAYVGVNEDGLRIVSVRPLDGSTVRNLAGTEDTSSLFFSPDGLSIGVFRGDRLERVPMVEGTPSSIVAFSEKDFWGASWGEDDAVVYAVGRSGLKTVSARGGKPTVLTELDTSRAEGSHRLPHHVTGHKVLLFTVLIEGAYGEHEIWAADLSTGERRYLLDGSKASYLSSGYIVVSRPGESLIGGSLWLAPFDPDRMEVTGPLELIEGSVGGLLGQGHTVAPNGVMVYQPSQGNQRADLVLIQAGNQPRVLGEAGRFEAPRFSNDGNKVAVARFLESMQMEIRIYDLESGADYQFAERGEFPLWDADDRGITYTEQPVGIVHQQLDDPDSKETLVPHPQVVVANGWINGGKSLVYSAVNPETVGDLYVLHADGQRDHVYSRGATAGSVTPDDQWLALCTWPRGILIGKLPKFTSIATPSTQGCFPKWSNGGSHLFSQDYDRLWKIETKLTPSGVALGARNVVAELAPGRGQYDVDKSGRLILVRRQFENPSPPVLLLNWFKPHAADQAP